jgi:sigma-B regulation protein RsbU (phosphoserine phosphatase)
MEIHDIRTGLAKKVEERTEELKVAYDSLNHTYRLMRDDLQLAKKIQNSIMPRGIDLMGGVRLSVYYYPMSEIGGDIYDMVELNPGYYRFFLGDATGHGIQAALVTMIIKSEFEKVKKLEVDPSGVLEILNNNFLESYESLNVLFSCVIIDIDLNRGKIFFASAGHPEQFLVHDGALETVTLHGKIIGVLKDTQYKVFIKDIDGTMRLILFTDGLFEQFNDRDEAFGFRRIREAIGRAIGGNTDEIIKSVVSELRLFLGAGEKISIDDDITILGIEIKKENGVKTF